MKFKTVHNAQQLMQLIQKIGFLPLLDSCVPGFSAMEIVGEECRYSIDPEGGFDWPLWDWKGPIIQEGGVVYGKFFDKKAGFISLDWWNDFMTYRRSKYPLPEEGSIEDTILFTLRQEGSLITRDLRRQCGFTGSMMRSKFDSYVTRLEMACRIVTEDFVYPTDSHGRQYGWGWSLLTTPERFLGAQTSKHSKTSAPEDCYDRLFAHFQKILPKTDEKQIRKILG